MFRKALQNIKRTFYLIFLILTLIISFKKSYGSLQSLKKSSSYAPVEKDCPKDHQLIRISGSSIYSNQSLSKSEIKFCNGRRNFTSSNWREFFKNGPGSKTNYQSNSSIFNDDNDWPILGIAHSGGGERAALYSAAVVKALDSRTSISPIGGIFQLLTYQTGLSGSSWMIMSLATNDFPPVDKLVAGWQLERDILFPGNKSFENARYLEHLIEDCKRKKDAKFESSITDVWGRALSNHFLPGTTRRNFFKLSNKVTHGSGILFSSLADSIRFKEFNMPYPIIVSHNKPPNSDMTGQSKLPTQGNYYVPLSTTVFESSPFEFGSFDPYLSAFIPTKYLGTRLEAGKPIGGFSGCVTAFDQASFIMGTSSSLFNAVFSKNFNGLDVNYMTIFKKITKAISKFDSLEHSTSAIYPNPFKGVNGHLGFDSSNLDDLVLVDGGEGGENVALNPLLAPARKVEVIIASDASADTNQSDPLGANWPNGASMTNTFIRIRQVLPKGSASFPEVPLNSKEWIARGLNTRPTFFGCKAINTEGNGGLPLVTIKKKVTLARQVLQL
ncbi:lysophospholipase catalytic domain-domain-containing protein [Phakopsora pachyrhizi]|uniref:Lysophospholipase n=1 Tax=Phakopsora pachyrhizi TaxID=170000 RepID=A0AAV0B8X8_PHAPC|nr:lysophospholipase catalytic domain-domain-containing protein [Phakopsora pachyrhizi]